MGKWIFSCDAEFEGPRISGCDREEVTKQVENAHCSSENKSNVPRLSREDLSGKVYHIDFILGDEQPIVNVCGMVIQIPQFKHQFSRLYIQSNFGHQRKQCLKKTSKKILCQASRPYPEKEDQPKTQKFLWKIFDPGGHLHNSRSSSPQEGETNVDHCQTTSYMGLAHYCVCISFYFHLQLCSVAHCWEQFSLFLPFLSLTKIRS